MRFLVSAGLSLVLAYLAGCGGSSLVNGGPPHLTYGTWGGDHVEAVVSESGVTLRFDCAAGDIPVVPAIDSAGAFSVDGRYQQQHPGRVVVGQEPAFESAQYAGHLERDVLTLSITLARSSQSIGPFTLTHGQAGRVRPCR